MFVFVCACCMVGTSISICISKKKNKSTIFGSSFSNSQNTF